MGATLYTIRAINFDIIGENVHSLFVQEEYELPRYVPEDHILPRPLRPNLFHLTLEVIEKTGDRKLRRRQASDSRIIYRNPWYAILHEYLPLLDEAQSLFDGLSDLEATESLTELRELGRLAYTRIAEESYQLWQAVQSGPVSDCIRPLRAEVQRLTQGQPRDLAASVYALLAFSDKLRSLLGCPRLEPATAR